VQKFIRYFKVLIITFVLFKRLNVCGSLRFEVDQQKIDHICNWLKEFYNQVHDFSWDRFSTTELSTPLF